MVVLITGSTGFIGRHLVRFLLDRGYTVHAVRRATSAYEFHDTARPDLLHEHSYDGTYQSILSILSETKPDSVVHLATHYVADHKPEEIDLLVDANIRFGIQLLEAASMTDTNHFVWAGTNWQKQSEDGDYSPLNLYTATKEAFEKCIEFYTHARRLSADIVYLYETYAADDHRKKLLHVLMHAAMTGEEINMTPGYQRINLVHVDDVCRAIATLMEAHESSDMISLARYTISSSDTLTIRELVTDIERVTGRRIRARWGAAPYRQNTVLNPWVSGETPPGWHCQVDLEEGLGSVWESTTESQH